MRIGRRQIDVAQREVTAEIIQIMIEAIGEREILVIVNGTDVKIDIVSKDRNVADMKKTVTETETEMITIVDIHVKIGTDTTLGTQDR